MNIYYFTTQPNIAEQKNLAVIICLQKVGAVISSNIEGLANAFEFPKRIDALVILDDKSGDIEHREISYMIALAIAHQKPILYLLSQGALTPQEVHTITESKEMKKFIRVEYVTKDKISIVVKAFIEEYVLRGVNLSIKFTLRLNSDLDVYLSWKSKKARMSKADFVRKIIEDYKASDTKYPGYKPKTSLPPPSADLPVDS